MDTMQLCIVKIIISYLTSIYLCVTDMGFGSTRQNTPDWI